MGYNSYVKIVFTKHARKKFRELKEIGVIISRQKVIEAIRNPEHIDKESDAPKIIASRAININHILRVVFKEEDGIITVITFYPAKKGRYYEEKN